MYTRFLRALSDMSLRQRQDQRQGGGRASGPARTAPEAAMPALARYSEVRVDQQQFWNVL